MTVVQYLIDGVSLGAIYGLVAIGIGLVFGVMRLVNFAYGELITAGGYTLAYLNGEPAAVAIIACFAVVIALALIQERIVFRPLRAASPITMLVASFAVSFLLQAIYLLSFRSASGQQGKIVATLGGLNSAIIFHTLVIRWILIVSMISGVGLLAVTALILNKTNIGLHMRAAAMDFRTARVLGVRANRVIMFAFALSGVLAASVSVLYTVQQDPLVTPDYGVSITILALVGVVVGGLDRLWTATLGGFVIGFLYSLFGDILSSAHGKYLQSVVFGIVIVVLLVSPSGLFSLGRHTSVERV